MNIIISHQQVESNRFKPLTPVYDGVYISTDEDFEDNNNVKITSKNTKKLFDVINYSWDGEIYWFLNQDKEIVLKELEEWFHKEENHHDTDDNGIYNCLLMKKTPNGICLIDTQYDMSSNFSDFLFEFNKKYPDISYESYSDCHLIDNIKLGRGSINNEFETLYLFYKENMIDSSFFLNGLERFYVNEEDEGEEYYQLLPHDKTIVITGKLACEREYILYCLQEAGYTTADKVTANSWLWYGDKVGANKIQAAKEKNILCSSIDEVIEMAYQTYLQNKKSS